MKSFELGRARRVAIVLASAVVASLGLASGAMADSPPSGAFVIGDQSFVAPGDTVTFWGAQWWKDNSLSGGSAPASFKGFADTAIPQCGQTWTTRPGNSSDPPAALTPLETQGLIPVVVATTITKSGPQISGDTAEIAWVAPDPGYQADPGHPGTGTVVTVGCSSTPFGGGSGGGLPD